VARRTAVNERQAKAAAIRAAAERKQRRLMVTLSAIAAVVVVILGLVIVSALNKGKTSDGSSQARTPISSTVEQGVTQVPTSVFDAVGRGSATIGPKAQKDGKAMTEDGKPRILYVGAEYCPYCAAERWPLVTALSRFGTFKGLGETSSSASDVYPNTPTLSFHGATFTSKYLAFKGYETTDNQHQQLDQLSDADGEIFNKYDNPPYVSSSDASAIPFVLYGGEWVTHGTSFDPGILAGKTHEEIAKALSDPDDPITKAVVGNANEVTATLCKLTQNQPADVCASKGVTTTAASS
jgi:hypothetical protein